MALAVTALAAACTHTEPPTPPGDPAVAAPDMSLIPADATIVSAPGATGGREAGAAGDAPTSGASPTAMPETTALHQTHDRPAPDSQALHARAVALWEAIATDEPEHGMAFFFPLSAYQQVKDVADPAADWKHRLVAAYARDIHRLHAELGAAPATFVDLDVPDARARWVEPGEEWNKVGYFRVFGSKLVFEQDGARRSFEVKSLISWRGEWFVVHLTAVR